MTTNQTAPVTDEELDQMILKLERDGMTPKMLSLMRELREVRRAKGEPVAYADPQAFINFKAGGARREWMWRNPGEDLMPLYTVPPAPVVPTNVADAIERLKQRLADCHRFNYCAEAVREVEDACRAAMLNHSGDTADMAEPVSNRDELNSPATSDGWIPVSERMPDPKSELRVCVYTPTPHEDIRYRFVPASLFKAVCRDATHWHYMSAPKEVG